MPVTFALGGNPPRITDIYLFDTSFVDPALVDLKCMGGSPDARGGVSHGEANNASGRRRVPSGAPRGREAKAPPG